MVDNEERKLFFSELQKNTQDTYKLTKLGELEGSCFPITMLWKNSITKQEAIDKMAKAMFVRLYNFSNLECEVLAKVALNALLGVEK